MPLFSLTINGRVRQVDGDADMPLLWALRDRLGLFGTKYGCGVGLCGACTVHENGRAVRSCTITLAGAAGKSYVTIEGLSPDGTHPCQRAWIDEDVAQCGFCQPGMIMETAALLGRSPSPTDREIDEVLASHVCRCGTYARLRAAVHRAAAVPRRSERAIASEPRERSGAGGPRERACRGIRGAKPLEQA